MCLSVGLILQSVLCGIGVSCHVSHGVALKMYEVSMKGTVLLKSRLRVDKNAQQCLKWLQEACGKQLCHITLLLDVCLHVELNCSWLAAHNSWRGPHSLYEEINGYKLTVNMCETVK